MSDSIVVHKGRTNILKLRLGIDTSADTITSEIRTLESEKPLIAEWDVQPETDGTDGVYILTLDNVITAQITVDKAYMDVLRVSGGEPLPVFDGPLIVEFRETVTEYA